MEEIVKRWLHFKVTLRWRHPEHKAPWFWLNNEHYQLIGYDEIGECPHGAGAVEYTRKTWSVEEAEIINVQRVNIMGDVVDD